MLDQVLRIFDITPDYDLNIMKQGQDLYDVTARVLTGMRDVLREAKPDVVLVHGDTTTSTAATLAKEQEAVLATAGHDLTRLGNGKKLVLITGHRRENFGDGFIRMVTAMKDLSEKYPDVDFVYPMHLNPNVRKPIHEVLGDTNSCLSVIGAKRLHIPIFHMEAGNRCKDECLPEETNRRIVDIISDVNMAYSEHARRYLADCGLPKERTYVTGSPMAEVLHNNLADIESSDVHQRLGLEKGRYILLSAHREENIDTEKNFRSLFTAINKMAEKYDMPILYSCHPRSRNRLAASGFVLDERVLQHEPLGFHDYNCLQMNAFAVVSDSGTLPEESSFFTSVGHPFPAVCIRTSTERPEAIDKGDFIIAGIDEKSLLQAVDTAVALCRDGNHGIPVPDYVDENVSTKVVKIIQSYVGIVNKMVWRKE